MTAKVLESFGGKFAEQWVATLLTPAFVFWLGGFATAIQRYGWQTLVTEFTRHPEPLQIAILVGCLCIIAASAFVMQRFDLATLRFLEGYWHPWLHCFRQQRVRHYRARWKRLVQQRQELRATEEQRKQEFAALEHLKQSQGGEKLSVRERDLYLQLCEQLLTLDEQGTLIRLGQFLREMPNTSTDLMPTRLGNLLRAAERKPLEKYGLDAIVCWSRLWMLLPDAVKKDLQEARADLNTAARAWLWSLLFCGWTFLGWNLWATWSLLLGICSAWFAYQWAIDAARTYSELIEAAFDLYRHLLYQSIRWNLPPEPEDERRVGADLTRYLLRGF